MLLKEFSRMRAAMSGPIELIDNRLIRLDAPAGCLNNLSTFRMTNPGILEGVYVAPYVPIGDRLTSVDTLLLPDFVSVDNPRCMKYDIIRGVPTWVLEILSVSKREHIQIWFDVGVPHVWLVDEESDRVLCYTRNHFTYQQSVHPLAVLCGQRAFA